MYVVGTLIQGLYRFGKVLKMEDGFKVLKIKLAFVLENHTKALKSIQIFSVKPHKITVNHGDRNQPQ